MLHHWLWSDDEVGNLEEKGRWWRRRSPNPTRLKRTCSNRTWKNRRLNQRKVFQTSIFNHFYVRNLLVSGRVPVFFFNARFTQGFFQCLKNLVVFSWDQRLHTCAKASNLTKPTQCQKHLCFHITLWNPQPSPWCPSWVFLISWLVVLQLFFHVEAMLFDHQWLEYEGDVGLSEVVGRCFWFMNRLQVFSYIVDVIGVCWLERHLYQFVTSLWFNHVIFLHFDKECFSSETRDAGVLVVHVGGPSWTVRNPWMLCFFQVNWPRDNTKSWKSGKGELSLWGWILKCNLTCSETYVKHVIMYVDSIRTCDMKNLDPDSSVGPDESHVDNCEAFPLLL